MQETPNTHGDRIQTPESYGKETQATPETQLPEAQEKTDTPVPETQGREQKYRKSRSSKITRS